MQSSAVQRIVCKSMKHQVLSLNGRHSGNSRHQHEDSRKNKRKTKIVRTLIGLSIKYN